VVAFVVKVTKDKYAHNSNANMTQRVIHDEDADGKLVEEGKESGSNVLGKD